MKFNAFRNLVRYRFMRLAIRRIKCIVIAIRTTAQAFRAIAVGTGEAGIDSNFLHARTEFAFKIFGIGIIPAVMPPWESSGNHSAKVDNFCEHF
jgi:hypothetical protein